MGVAGCGKGGQVGLSYAGGGLIVLVILILGMVVNEDAAGTREIVDVTVFETTLERALYDDISSMKAMEHGTQRTVEYDFPNDIDEICFVDLDMARNPLYTSILDSIDDPAIREVIRARPDENVHVFKGNAVSSMFIEDLSLKVLFFCVPSKQSEPAFVLENQGRAGVIVRTPVNPQYCENADVYGICEALDEFFYDGYSKICHDLNNDWCAP